jgi:hypothetical protein
VLRLGGEIVARFKFEFGDIQCGGLRWRAAGWRPAWGYEGGRK